MLNEKRKLQDGKGSNVEHVIYVNHLVYDHKTLHSDTLAFPIGLIERAKKSSGCKVKNTTIPSIVMNKSNSTKNRFEKQEAKMKTNTIHNEIFGYNDIPNRKVMKTNKPYITPFQKSEILKTENISTVKIKCEMNKLNLHKPELFENSNLKLKKLITEKNCHILPKIGSKSRNDNVVSPTASMFGLEIVSPTSTKKGYRIAGVSDFLEREVLMCPTETLSNKSNTSKRQHKAKSYIVHSMKKTKTVRSKHLQILKMKD